MKALIGIRALVAALIVSSQLVTAAQASGSHLHTFNGLALSPIGDVIADVEVDAGDTHGKVLMRAVADGHVLRTLDPCPGCEYSDIAFAKNGSLAFLARSHDSTVSLQLWAVHSAQTIEVGRISGEAQMLRFSPDGKRIALLVTLGVSRRTGATEAGARPVGEVGSYTDEQRLATFDIGASDHHSPMALLSPPDRYVYEFDWLPNDRGLVISDAPGDGDSGWWTASLDSVDLTGGPLHNIAKPATQMRRLCVSPDGRTVAFIGGLMSDFGSVGGDVWSVPVVGGVLANVTRDRRTTVTSLFGRATNSLPQSSTLIRPASFGWIVRVPRKFFGHQRKSSMRGWVLSLQVAMAL